MQSLLPLGAILLGGSVRIRISVKRQYVLPKVLRHVFELMAREFIQYLSICLVGKPILPSAGRPAGVEVFVLQLEVTGADLAKHLAIRIHRGIEALHE